jgi:hypothetical protein
MAAPSPSSSGSAFVDTACAQAAATATNALTVVTPSFFTSIVPNGRTICLSAWDLSSNVVRALETAAHNGGNVIVITPLSQKSRNSFGIATIVAAGGHAKYEYTSSPGIPASSIAYQQAPMDIQAKFALIDGVAYLDAASASAPAMHVIVESFSGYSGAAKAALQNLMLHDPNAFVRTDNHGHEKISMFRPTAGGAPSGGVWFGASNSTTTDLFDWGMDISDTGVMTALASHFDTEWSGASPIPTASPGVAASPCPSLHM